jgi:hypothetical protein
VPGAAWGIVIDGELAHTGAAGVRNITSNTPVDADTVFRIASMTKSFTAMAILKLRKVSDWSIVAPWDRTLAARAGGPKQIRVPRDPRRAIVGYLEDVGHTQRIPNTPAAASIIDSHHGASARLIVTVGGAQLVEVESGTVVPAFDRPATDATRVRDVENYAAGFVLLTTGGAPSQHWYSVGNRVGSKSRSQMTARRRFAS